MSYYRGGFAGYGTPGHVSSPGRYGNYGRYGRPWSHGLGGSNPAAISPDDPTYPPDIAPTPPSSAPTIGQQILHGARAGLASVAITAPLTIGLTALLYFTGLLGNRDPSQYGYKDTTDIYGPVTFGAHRAQAHNPNCYYHQRRW